jgi:CBS domain containing-hemolysin-like protein
VERVDERTIRIDGTYTLDDFNEEFGTSLEQEDYHTLGGFVFDALGRAAEPGDEVATDEVRLRVLETSGSRIHRLEIEFLAPSPDEPADTPEAA